MKTFTKSITLLSHPWDRPRFRTPLIFRFLEHEEGVFVSFPDLPSCYYQWATIKEAGENIFDDIEIYLACAGEDAESVRKRLRNRMRRRMTDARAGEVHRLAVKALRREGFQKVNPLSVVEALQKVGFEDTGWEGRNVILFHDDGEGVVLVPRANPVDDYTMVAILRAAGLTFEGFKNLLLKSGANPAVPSMVQTWS